MKALQKPLESLDRYYANWRNARRAAAAFFMYGILYCLILCLTGTPLLLGGKSVVWRFDSSGEYYITFVRFRDAMRSLCAGQGYAQFDLRIGLGDDVISSLNFYGFGDPLIALLALLPVQNTEALFTFGVYVRQFLAGWLCYLYLRQMGASRGMSVLGAVCFAFCAFVNNNTLRHQLFLNAAMYLPAALLGYERALKGRSPWLLAVSSACLAACTYYFSYMVSLFMIFYALIRFFQTYPRGGRAKAFREIAPRCAVAWILGFCMAGVILLPSIYGFFHSARLPKPLSENLLFYSPTQYIRRFSLSAFPLKANFSTVALPAVFSAVLLCTRGYIFRKRANICVFALIAAYALCPWVSYMMNGFSHVSGRSVFCLSLMASLAFALTGEKLLALADVSAAA